MTTHHSRVRIGFALAIVTMLLCGAYLMPVSAQRPPPDHRFGAIEAFRDPVAAAEVGVGWERILLYWSELQPSGPDDWNLYHVPNDWLDLAAQADREVVGLIKHTPQWATDGTAGCGVPRGLYLPIDDPGNLWANFVRLVVGKYQGRIDRWIIWNEPDIAPTTYGSEWCGSVDDYYQLLKVAYIAAHQVNPNVTIHLAGLTYWHDQRYLQKLLAVATRDPSAPENGYYFDVVSLHIYFNSETVSEIFSAVRGTLSAYGINKPIWLNETNAPPNSDPQWQMPEANYEINLEEQANFLLQSFAPAATRFRALRHHPARFQPASSLRRIPNDRESLLRYRLSTGESPVTLHSGYTQPRQPHNPGHVGTHRCGGHRISSCTCFAGNAC